MAPRTHLWETVLAGKWSNLGDATLQDALEAAYSSGSDGYQFKARGYTYDVDFGRMKQINVTTKRERNLRRVPDPRASSVATAAVAPTSGMHLPSTKLYHGPSAAARVYTGPTAGSLPVAAAAGVARSSGPTKATYAGSVVLHPGPAPSPVVAPAPVSKTAPSPVVAPAPVSKTTAPPTKAKSAAPTTAKSLVSVATTAPSGTKSATTATSWRTAKAPATTAWKTAVAAPLPVAPPVAPAPPPPAPVKMPLPHQGKVKTFFKEKGYGFIQLDDNQEVFFHVSSVSELLDGSIRANDTVEVSVSKSGKPRALQVRVKRRGSIFKQMCSNKCCRDRGDRHFEDRCPLKRKRGDGDDASVSTACS